MRLSGLLKDVEADIVASLAEPPTGCRFTADAEGFSICCALRGRGVWALTLGALAWNGVEVQITINSLRYGDLSSLVDGWVSLLYIVFPGVFVWGGLFLAFMAIRGWFGHTCVTVHGKEGRIFTGIGRLGLTRRFDWSAVMHVQEEGLGNGYSQITLVARRRRTRVGGGILDTARRQYLLAVLAAMIARRKRLPVLFRDVVVDGRCSNCGHEMAAESMCPEKGVAFCPACQELLAVPRPRFETDEFEGLDDIPVRERPRSLTMSGDRYFRQWKTVRWFVLLMIPVAASGAAGFVRDGTFLGGAMLAMGTAVAYLLFLTLCSGGVSSNTGTYFRSTEPIRYWLNVIALAVAYLFPCLAGWFGEFGSR